MDFSTKLPEPDEDLKIRQELERKYLEALANVAAKMDQGEISQEAGRVAFEAVYQSVSGLVDWDDLNDIMGEAHDIEPAPYIQRRVFLKGGSLVVIDVEVATLRVVAFTGVTQHKREVRKLESQGDAWNEAERVADGLLNKAWTELA